MTMSATFPARLCAISTFGVGNNVPGLGGHIQSFQFERGTPPAISPNDGVWLYCPNKYNLKGLDGYLLESKTGTDKLGRATVKVGREFIIRALQITLESTFKEMRKRLASLAPACCTIRYEMWWIATRSEIATGEEPAKVGDFEFKRRFITFTEVHPDIELAIEEN